MSLSPLRRHVFIGATLFISVGGALLGASLRSKQQKQEVSRKVAEFTPEQRIEMLEETRSRLVAQKEMLHQKIDTLKARVERKRVLEREGDRLGINR